MIEAFCMGMDPLLYAIPLLGPSLEAESPQAFPSLPLAPQGGERKQLHSSSLP